MEYSCVSEPQEMREQFGRLVTARQAANGAIAVRDRQEKSAKKMCKFLTSKHKKIPPIPVLII